jgi:predicted transglutaminase-like cysteine proteinase
MWKRGFSSVFGHGGLTALLLALAVAVSPTGAAASSKRPHLVAAKDVSAPDGFSGVCARYDWACARGGRNAVTGSDLLALADRVNLGVNQSTREISDEAQYAQTEHWALPTSRGGDCEDFALAKKQALISRGVAPERLLIATVLDRKRSPHAVLVLRTDAGDYVLDNLTNRILGWRDTGYTFLRMQNPDAPGRWSAVLAGGVLGG